jgi:hypothetical protein
VKRKRVFIAGAIALLFALQPFAGLGTADAELGACEDPANDTQLDGTGVKGPGKLDIVVAGHVNDADFITWVLVTNDPFDADDVDQIVWDIDLDGDGEFEGSILVDGDPLEATLRDADANKISDLLVFQEQDFLAVGAEPEQFEELGDPGLTYEYVLSTLESSLVGEYRTDSVGPCEHNLKIETADAVVSLTSSTVTAGGTVGGTASGFGPESEAMVFIKSDPVLLGTVTVSTQGVAAFNLAVPTSITPGQHTIEVRGVDAGGNAVVATAPVTVLAQVATPTPLTSPGATTNGLPNNGMNAARQTSYGLLLVAIGLLLLAFVTARRMRTDILRDDDQFSS